MTAGTGAALDDDDGDEDDGTNVVHTHENALTEVIDKTANTPNELCEYLMRVARHAAHDARRSRTCNKIMIFVSSFSNKIVIIIVIRVVD